MSHRRELRPVILIVEGDATARTRAVEDLRERFGGDYDFVDFAAGADALAWLESEPGRGAAVAVLLSNLILPDQRGADFLEAAHHLQPLAQRGLLVSVRPNRLPIAEREELHRASSFGQVDFSVVSDWVNPEQTLYPLIQEAISLWSSATERGLELVKVIGYQWSPQTHQIRETLARNTVPFGFYDAESDAGKRLLEDYHATGLALPVMTFPNGGVLSDPTMLQAAEALGVPTVPKQAHYDVVILGAGPAGLAAAIYGISEGLSTLLVEPAHLGGQAGSSSMIRNYLGFPRGVSGGELTGRAYDQASLFGVDFLFMQQAQHLETHGPDVRVSFSDCDAVLASAVIIATGVAYRWLGIPSVEHLVGRGVYYGSPGIEAPAMTGEHVYVVGGANSAGQAAIHLARYAESVTVLVRGESLVDSMSTYLITELDATDNVVVRTRTEVVEAIGSQRLHGLVIEHAPTGVREAVEAAGLFILIGAKTRTEWLQGTLALDERGYILTGRDLPPGSWRGTGAPLPFETSMPNVFAVGDVHSGSSKRVAAAVGEGSVAIGSVHKRLAERHER